MKRYGPLAGALLLCLVAIAGSAAARQANDAQEQRLRRGDEAVARLNRGQPQPTLEAMRRDFPALADAVRGYALGEAWSGEALDPKTRQLAAVAAFAATGQQPFLRIHAGYALNVGVTEAQLKDVVMLTTVTAGFARAIEASQTLSALFAERRAEAAR
jgi:4-carboxymuconolactone decarboxylase